MKVSIQVFYCLCCVLLLGLSQGYAQTPVASYPFSGNARDQSGLGNHASIHGAKLTADRFGWARNAFLFDGEQSNLSAPNAAQINSDYTTISFWVRVDELPGQGEAFLMSHGGWQERWKISLPPHGKPVFTTNYANGISDMDSGDGNELPVGVWKHVVMVHDGVSDKIFFDGVLANSKAVAGALNATTNYPLGIGFNPIDKANYFEGAIDDVMLFDVALSDAEVAQLYADQSTAPATTPGIVANYSFSNSTRDGSAYGNHGTGKDLVAGTDRFGFGASAYGFNGTSSSVEVANSAPLNSDYTTVSFWVRVRNLPAQGEAMMLSHGGWQERWKISLPPHGKPVFTTNYANGISDMDAGDGNELQEGQWQHVVMVHDGVSDKIFVDGALANSKAVSGSLNKTTHPLGIGFDPIDKTNYFDGEIDEVRIYNYALSDQDVADLYAAQSTSPEIPLDLAAEYRLNGDVLDASQYANHGWPGSSATPVANRFGYASNAYSFAGQDSVYVSNSPRLNSDYATVSFWVRIGELPAQGEAFLLSNGGWQERWKISLPPHGKPVFTTNYENGISDMDSGSELPTGVWKHVVMVHNGEKDKIFIDGALANQKDVVGKLNPTVQPFGIGYNPIDGGGYFNGELDDIQVYDRAFTDSEVAGLFANQSQPPVFASDLVANYTFSGNTNDNTTYNNHATANGATLETDRFGKANQAIAFDGINDELTAANSPQQNSDYTTISFWINAAELPAQGEAFLLSSGGWQERWKISLPPHGKPVFTTNGSSGISDMDSGDSHVVTPGQWQHVVMVHDGTQDKIFFNGVLANAKGVTGTLNSTTHPLGIGYNPIDGGNFFKGALDEVRIYNRALSDAEVALLYDQQSQPPAGGDTETPSAPLDLTADVRFTTITLSWQAATDNVGVAAYNVYQDEVKILTTQATATVLADLAPLTDFVFGVSAVDAAGNESSITTLKARSGEDESPDVTPPTKPGNLSAVTGSYSVLLSWEPSIDDRQVAGYVVLVDGETFDTLPGTATSVLVTGLDPETLYTFEVYAYDNAGNESEIAEITVSTDPEIVTSEPGLVAWYPFEGNADDATPYANHGVIGGNPTFETVQNRPNAAGSAIVFDGQQDSVLAPNAVQLISDFTTVSFWIRVDGQNLADAEAYVIDFGQWSQRWKISLPQHLKVVWTTNSKNAQFDNFISDMDSGDGNELSKGFWWFVTMVHDGVNDIIYLDGQEANRKPVTGTLNSTNLPLGMGNNSIDGGQFFHGALDEVKIYNKALTADEILSLYNTGTTSIRTPETIGKYVRTVYPSPVREILYVDHTLDHSQPLLIRVMDASGRQVDAIRYQKNELPSDRFSVDVRSYPEGIYFLNFISGETNLGAVKFVKN